MDLSQLAQLGEFVGGIAVLVTVIYVAIQVKQSNAIQRTATEMARAEAIESSVKTWSTWRQMLANRELAEIWTKAEPECELSPEEATRLGAMIAELTYASLGAYEKYRAAGAVEFEDTPPAVIARAIGTSPALRKAWLAMVDELEYHNLDNFAAQVTAKLEPVRQ